jgi:hypothetical protein
VLHAKYIAGMSITHTHNIQKLRLRYTTETEFIRYLRRSYSLTARKKKISADFEIDLKIFKILQTLPLQGDLYNLLTIVWLVRKSENDNYKNNNPHACIG